MKVIYLVRHCKAEGQEAEANLTLDGFQQANALSELLSTKPIDCIMSSPYKRARLSVEPLAFKLGLTIQIDNRLTERVLTTQPTENWLTMLKATFIDLDLSYEGGESSQQAMKRAVSVIDELMGSKYEHIVIASHGNLISLILKHFFKAIGFKEWEVLSNPDVFMVELSSSNNVKITRLWKQ